MKKKIERKNNSILNQYFDRVSICILKSTIEEDNKKNIHFRYQIHFLDQQKKSKYYSISLNTFNLEEETLASIEKELRYYIETEKSIKIDNLTYVENYKSIANSQKNNPRIAKKLKNNLEEKLNK